MIKILPKSFLFVLLFGFSVVNAQQVTEGSSSVEIIEEELTVRQDTTLYFSEIYLNASRADSIRNLKRYAYLQGLESLLRQQKVLGDVQKPARLPWILSWLSSGLFQVIAWAFAISAILAVVFHFLKRKKVLSVTAPDNELSAEEMEEYLPENTGKWFEEAKQNKDFRSAVKFLFLKTLYKLSENNLIIFTPDKTNSQYLHELPEYLKESFAAISHTFEFTWYGKQNLSEAAYTEKEKLFIDFLKKIPGA